MDVSHQIKLISHLQKLPEEVFINRHHDATTFGASLTTHETRDVGNTGLPEFGATVPDIGPRRPKSIIDMPRDHNEYIKGRSALPSGTSSKPYPLPALEELPNPYLAELW
ncbi:hypothetical protein PIB30_089066 [Stylosanthes scabra]|uniref:Uncharacterized protein n=1 Tax=Stylosanthes scabra TaxID=79078 RepID=A0ABU6QV86_9FABA|nr:hypothetical protein [Stylosanthes scabra]